MKWLVGLLVLTWLGLADARPGGGHSYSGGSSRSSSSSYRSSSSGSSSGSSSSPALVGFLIVFLVVCIVLSRMDTSQESWTSSTVPPATRTDVQRLVDKDPLFSQVVFEDFVFQLFAAAHRARGDRAKLAPLTPYLDTRVIDALADAPAVRAVVIGSLRIISVGLSVDRQHVGVRVEANLVGEATTRNVVERWTFIRHHDAKTRAPEQTRMFTCPSCNAPFTQGADPRTCSHCGSQMEAGRFDWTATERVVGSSSSVGPTLTGTVAEVGTHLPTIVDDRAFPELQALTTADPNVTWPAVEARASMIYGRLNAAWNAQDLAPLRGLVTGSLLGYLQFWIDEYKRQGLANRLDDAKLHRFQLAKVMRDPYYDAITIRLWADGHDYTVDAKGATVGGSRTDRRLYSEYWTFIRSASRRGPVSAEPRCPNCGAPLAIGDTGACTHCSAIVESGAFDWLLSKIEQDEVYRG